MSLVTNMVEARTAPGTELEIDDRTLTLVSSRPHGHRWLMVFEGVTDRDQADALRGRILRAAPLSPDGFEVEPESPTALHGAEVVAFVHDLIGCRLVDQRGTDHGEIVSVLENPASDLLELVDGRLVPLTFFRSLDAGSATVSVEVPEGLLDGASETIATER